MLGILSKAASELVVHRPLAELFEHVLDLLFEAVPAERGAILLLEGGPPQPVIKASRSRSGRAAHPGEPLDRAPRPWRSGSRCSCPTCSRTRASRAEDSILASGIRSAMCAPLWFTATGEGRRTR